MYAEFEFSARSSGWGSGTNGCAAASTLTCAVVPVEPLLVGEVDGHGDVNAVFV